MNPVLPLFTASASKVVASCGGLFRLFVLAVLGRSG